MKTHPIAIIGAGSIGLAAAAHAQSRGMPVVVLEAGQGAGTSVREWGHVRLFSPWSELIDPAARHLLESTGWTEPEATAYPTGAEWVAAYLQPLAEALVATAEVTIHYSARGTGVARRGRDRVVDGGRDQSPFTIQVRTESGPCRLSAQAVIDASGSWNQPNPLGGDGLPADGESAAAGQVSYQIPDLQDPRVRSRYAGRHVAVAGTGASAQNVLVDLARLAREKPGTSVSWLVRRESASGAFGGGPQDQLVARGALGDRARQAVESGPVRAVTGFWTESVQRGADGRLTLVSAGGERVAGVDEVIVVTGFRPELTMLSEIRLDLDPVLSAPRELAPMIDPNQHSCGTVEPHGAQVLAHPERGFYLAGMKSYGRATSFLALTGFEQVRSIVAELAGDREAAGQVQLTLPETGVCGGAGAFDRPDAAGSGCCGVSDGPQLVSLGK